MDLSPLLAQLEGLNPLNPTVPISKGSGMVFKDVLLIIVTGLALGLVLVLFAKIYVRKSKERRHERKSDASPGVRPEDDEDEQANPKAQTVAAAGSLPLPAWPDRGSRVDVEHAGGWASRTNGSRQGRPRG